MKKETYNEKVKKKNPVILLIAIAAILILIIIIKVVVIFVSANSEANHTDEYMLYMETDPFIKAIEALEAYEGVQRGTSVRALLNNVTTISNTIYDIENMQLDLIFKDIIPENSLCSVRLLSNTTEGANEFAKQVRSLILRKINSGNMYKIEIVRSLLNERVSAIIISLPEIELEEVEK